MMVKFYYPGGDWCYRPLHTVCAIYHDEAGALLARVEKGDRSGDYTFEIAEFELIGPGERHR